MQKKHPHPVDVHVGGRVRVRRMFLKISQEKLGDKLGLTFQQIQKYERGHNRIGASRLWAIASLLDVPVSYFYDGLVSGGENTCEMVGVSDGAQVDYVSEFTRSGDGIRLMRALIQIKDRNVRRSIVQLVCSLAEENAAEECAE